MPMNTGQFLVLCEGSLLSKIWHDEGTPRPLQHASVMKVSSLDELYIEEGKMAGFGPLQLIDEGGPVTYDQAIAPIKKRWDYLTMGLGYKVTKKLIDNDRFGEVAKFDKDLKRSVDDTVETFAFGVLNYATSSSEGWMTGFDGLSLASASHTRLDGGAVQSNFANAALSYTAVQDALIAFRKIKNDRGRPFVHTPRKLYIAPDLMHTAEEIFGSVDRPTDATNATNTVRRFGITPEILDYVTSSTFAMLVANEHDMRFVWRNKPVTKNETEFDTDTIKRKVTMDVLRGHGEWRGVYLIND